MNLYTGERWNLKAYGTLGQFILRETGALGANQKDAELFAYQVGLNPSFDTGLMKKPAELLSALSVYTYPGYAGNNNWRIGAQSLANGNIISEGDATKLDAMHFNVLSVYQEVALYPHNIPFRPFGEWANNMSDSSGGVRDASNAWSMGTKLGKIRGKGDWETSYAYKWIGANSVVGAFNDTDFGSATYGGAGRRGSVIKLGYGLTDNITVNGSAFLVNSLNTGYTNVNNGTIADEEIRRFQLDLNWKF